MNRPLLMALLVALCASLAGPTHAATVSPHARIQGRVDTAGGAPASGTYDLTFTLFPTESGGTALFTQTVADVEVSGGLFDVTIGPLGGANLGAHGSVWLETRFGAEPPLPRQEVLPGLYALVAEHANQAGEALSLACSGCVAASEVDFPYAASSVKGGPAADLLCSGCVAATDVAAGAIGTAQIQDSGVLAADVGFNYAGSASKGGPASDVTCPGCVGSADLATDRGCSRSTRAAARRAPCSACRRTGGSASAPPPPLAACRSAQMPIKTRRC